MIFQPNKYSTILPITEEDEDVKSFVLCVESADKEFQWFDDPKHQGGVKELKDKMLGIIDGLRNRASNAAGQNDGFTIRGILNKLRDMFAYISRKIKEALPKVKGIFNTIANYIMDAIDYIKEELS